LPESNDYLSESVKLVLYFVAQRYIVAGLSAGAVKG